MEMSPGHSVAGHSVAGHSVARALSRWPLSRRPRSLPHAQFGQHLKYWRIITIKIIILSVLYQYSQHLCRGRLKPKPGTNLDWGSWFWFCFYLPGYWFGYCFNKFFSSWVDQEVQKVAGLTKKGLVLPRSSFLEHEIFIWKPRFEISCHNFDKVKCHKLCLVNSKLC
jgi:hypothetical protein